MHHKDIINFLINKRGFKSYLEIGVYDGKNLEAIKCKRKVGVDPDRNTKAHYHLTSDQYFQRHRDKYDLIFIDGDHTAAQVYKDINNALSCLNPGGIIVVHDLNPTTEEMQRVPRDCKIWTGDGWKAWVQARAFLPFKMFVIDTDFGVGIIDANVSQHRQWYVRPLEYETLTLHRTELLNLITIKQFLCEYE